MWFQFEPVTSYLTRIKMPYVCAYYLEGSKQGLLIDTGWGVGDLKKELDLYAKKPYQVVLSHGHCDHGGGAGQFEEVYLSSKDKELETYSCSLAVRQEIYQSVTPYDNNHSQWLPQKQKGFLPLMDDQVFDLGGITVRVTSFPGHTSGSMAFWIERDQILITGDACSNPTLLNLDSSTDVETFLQASKNVHAKYPSIKRLFTSHKDFEEEPEILEESIRLAELILQDRDDRYPLKNKNGKQSYAALNKKLTKGLLSTNIIYRLDK